MRFFSGFILFSLLFYNFFSFTLVFAASNITLSSLNLNGSGIDLSLNPGDNFRINFAGKNQGDNTLTNVYGQLYFSNNSYFSFLGSSKNLIQLTTTNGDVSLTDYNQISGLNTLITTATKDNLAVGEQATFSPNPGTANNFSVSLNASTYQNIVYAKFSATDYYSSQIDSNIFSRIIYLNVRPHITDYYFEKGDGSGITTTQVQGSDAEPINLIVKVKDYNGCANISGGSVNANLSQLGLSTSESLSYDSCEADGKTAVFKKTGITTSASNGTYNISYDKFIATDSDNNSTDPNDANTNFDDEDKKTDLSITVVSADAPNVSLLSLNNQKIGGDEKTSYTLSFSGSQTGEYKVSLGSDGTCVGGTTLSSPEWITYDTVNSQIDFSISRDVLTEGNNSIYACIKNDGGNIGSVNIDLIKDITSPTTSFPIIFPANVIDNDSSIKFSCNEDGEYKVELGGNGTPGSGTEILNWTSATANTEYTTTITNNLLSLGDNTIYAYCKDIATNISYKTGIVEKVPATPSMVGTNITLSDNDFDNEGIDGRDISVSWSPTQEIIDATNFESYRLYILPSNIDFNTGSQTYSSLIADKNITSWTGNNSLIKDSLDQNLDSGGSYKICITIMGTSGQLGDYSCSPASIITGDTVEHATVTSAKFTSNTNLELTTDSTLDTDLSNHSGALISYTYNSTTLNPTAVASVNGTKINLTIQALTNLGATGSDVIVATGAIRSAVGGYNNYNTFATITDGQSPTITGFSNNTSSIHDNFFSGSINVLFSFAETMRANGYTKITFDRTAGNTSTQKSFPITDTAKLVSGNHTQNIDLSSILVSGTTYEMKLVGQDLAENSATSSAITVKFDNTGPTAATLIDQANTSSQTPTLSWNASTDDSGNGSGIKEYTIKIYNSADCSGGAIQTLTSATTSKATNSLSNGTYSWNVVAIDNMNNISTNSSCDSFIVDTSIPTISDLKITDIDNSNSTTHTKSGNTLNITANLTNTEISKIKADLSALTGNASHTGVVCDSPIAGITCNYTSEKVTYSFIAGFAGIISELVRQIKLIVSNPSEVTTTEQFVSITVDNSVPTGGDITGPTGTIGGNENEITFTNISDANLASVELGYILNSNYTFIHSGSALVSPYTWDTTSLIGGDYKIKITAKDRSGNEMIKESASFTLDKSAPTILANTITSPTDGQYITGNGSFDITWNSGNITDDSLAANPITLEYSTNNGTNWSEIATNLPNTGTYSWNIGNINGTEAKLRIKAIDSVGNESDYDTTNYTFTIDSSAPTIIFSDGTPPNGAFINDSGFQVVASLSDNIGLESASYSLERISDNNFWNGTTWTGSEVFNTITGSINSVNYNINELIEADIDNGINYNFTLKSTDKAANEKLTTTRQYTADTILPTLSITTASGTYLSGSLNIVGTSSDTGAGISSVSISIKKGSQYWDGSAWVGSEEKLITSTADDYANWSYDFTPPSGDNDGQNYEVIVYAYDKSYKVNNETSSNITITLDKTGPVIDNNLFTFDTSTIYAGGENLNITWNTGAIISTGAEIDNNSLVIDFYNGSVWENIGNNITNSGSYNYTLPTVNTTAAKFRIRILDNIGNISNQIDSSTFTIDSTPPTITSVKTRGDTNGGINWLDVYFNEEITNYADILNIFSSSTGTLSSDYNHKIQDDKTILELKFTNSIVGTDIKPTLTWSGNIIEDLSGKELISGNIVSTDNAQPVIIGAEIFDESNESGKFDKIEVTFSENLNGNIIDSSVFTINNPLAGLSIASVSTSNNIATIILDEQDNIQTNVGNMSLDFNSNINWEDSAGNQAHSKSSITLNDKAKPVITSALLKDISGDLDYIADTIELTFSESLSGSLAGFTTSSGTITSSGLVNNIITIGISGISGTNPSETITYNPGNLEDNFGNTLDTITVKALDEKISPELLKKETIDFDSNGQIDKVRLTFSEDINSDFSSFIVEVDGYNLQASPYTKSGANIVEISLQEKSTPDTGATTQFRIISNSSLKDTAGNNIKTTNLENLTDSVGPVIIGARFESGSNKIFLTFSETIDNTDFTTGNFTLNNAGAYSITNTDSGAYSITLSNETITYGTTEISFTANSVGDTLGNKQASITYTKISAPIIINEVMISDTENNNYIELRNLSNISVDISNWIIAGITIPATTNIAANGYFLISESDQATSIINIAPDLIDTNLDLSGNTITLNNGTIDIDNAKLDTGLNDTVTPKSIERKSNPGDGNISSNWYQAQSSVGFDNTTPLGTPGSENIFDATAPTISSNFPSTDDLLPMGSFDLSFNYTDDIQGLGVDIESDTLTLHKYNGTDAFDINSIASVNLGSKAITTTKATYPINNLAYGKYKAVFTIDDLAENTVTKEVIFYIDNFSFTLSTNNIDLGELDFTTNNFTNTELLVTIKTVGAGFILNLDKDGLLTTGVGGSDIINWNSSKGFGYDIEKTQIVNSTTTTPINYANTISAISSPSNLATVTKNINTSGNLNTYTYKLKYGAAIDMLQAAGIYKIDNNFNISIDY